MFTCVAWQVTLCEHIDTEQQSHWYTSATVALGTVNVQHPDTFAKAPLSERAWSCA